jgi:hypothetical protein
MVHYETKAPVLSRRIRPKQVQFRCFLACGEPGAFAAIARADTGIRDNAASALINHGHIFIDKNGNVWQN